VNSDKAGTPSAPLSKLLYSKYYALGTRKYMQFWHLLQRGQEHRNTRPFFMNGIMQETCVRYCQDSCIIPFMKKGRVFLCSCPRCNRCQMASVAAWTRAQKHAAFLHEWNNAGVLTISNAGLDNIDSICPIIKAVVLQILSRPAFDIVRTPALFHS
jgi:hypothetical protein